VCITLDSARSALRTARSLKKVKIHYVRPFSTQSGLLIPLLSRNTATEATGRDQQRFAGTLASTAKAN
jgi:hypothetical protein